MGAIRSVKFILPLAALFLSALACNAPQASSTPDLGFVVAQTQTAIALEQWLTATAAQPSQTPAAQIQPTETPGPSPATLAPATATATTPTGPTPTANCTDKAKFVNETTPDQSTFAPGESFTKSWTLQNVGTCTWSADYTLVLDHGEAFGSSGAQVIGATVAPNGMLELKLNLQAPAQPGTYESFWMLQNTRDEKFGLGKDADVAFWAKIVVLKSSASADPDLGAPDWQDSFDSSRITFYLGEDDDVGYKKQDGNLVVTAFRPAGDQWRVAELGTLRDFYLESQFITQDKCNGKDSFGLIFRAPDQPDNIVDSGYVADVSCEGKFRFYRMDNGNFTGLINWTAHPAIQKGPNKTNTLAIKAQDFSIQVLINGVQVLEFSDSAYESGYFGLVIRSESNAFSYAVSQMAYWLLP